MKLLGIPFEHLPYHAYEQKDLIRPFSPMVKVPALLFGVTAIEVSPVPPPLKPVTEKVVYGVVPPVTVIVWLYATFAVSAGSVVELTLSAGLTVMV